MAEKTQTPHGIFLYREYVDLLDGDIMAALMLSQIVYWYLPSKKTGKSKLRVFRNKSWWLAKNHDDWERECGFSHKQMRRCMDVLKERGHIETARFKFAGAPTTHIRLIAAKGKGKVLSHPTSKKLMDQLAMTGTEGQTHLPSGANLSAPKVKSYTENTTESTNTSSCASHQTGEAMKYPDEETGEWGDRRKEERRRETHQPEEELEQRTSHRREGVSMGVDQVLKNHADRRVGETGSLNAFWLRRCSALIPGYQKPLTGKEGGQLKQLQKYLTFRTRETIDFALNNWAKFAGRASAEAGVPAPSAPNIGFLLKYHAVAVNMMDEKKPVQSIAPETIAEPVAIQAAVEEKPHQLTGEELTQLLAGLDTD